MQLFGAILLGSFALLVLVGNIHGALQSRHREGSYSWIPLFTGGCGSAAILLWPHGPSAWWAMAPLLLEVLAPIGLGLSIKVFSDPKPPDAAD